MKKILPAILLLALFGFSKKSVAQENKKEEIAKVVNDYFSLERESIHAHFDKSIFLSNEKIWFKGYVLNRNENVPFVACINIFASLIDSEGNIIETKLFYGDMGSFSGNFTLGNKFRSGKYYIQFYTNWMNNFYEDESAVYEITIVNDADGVPTGLGTEFAEINISLQAEGRALIRDINNIVGISVLNCNGEPVKATTAEVLDSKGTVIKTIPLNKAGYGKFDLTPDGQNYTVSVTVNGTRYSQPVPASQLRGLSMEVNSYILPEKTTIKVRTNDSTISDLSDKPLYVLIHKDNNAVIYELNFKDKKTEQTIAVPNSDLYEGINTIRLLDSNMDQLAERLIYIYPQQGFNFQLSKGKEEAGWAEITGTVNKPDMDLSITVLPSQSLGLNSGRDLLGDLLIAPYLPEKQKFPARSYLNNNTRGGKYEMDLFLLSQQSKYNWNQMRMYPPKQNYTFDMGLDLTGKLNQTIKSPKDYKVKVLSLGNLIDEVVPLDGKNEFTLKNRVLLDSTSISFKLIKDGEQPVKLKLYPRITNNLRNFNKAYKPEKIACTPLPGTESIALLPEFAANTIMLDEVKLEGKAKTKLKYAKSSGNSMLRAYKITEVDAKTYFYILDFIRYHGFDVKQDKGNVSITGRNIMTINGQKTEPMIYINNIRALDYAQLIGMQMADVDEFYVNQHAIVPSVDNKMGIVRIYMKTDFGKTKTFDPAVDLMVKNGFEKAGHFRSPEYRSYDDRSFQNFGIIDWQPAVQTDEKGNFTIYVPTLYSGEVKVIIEGFSPDGKLISEVKTITL
jgi:hypothetical protein